MTTIGQLLMIGVEGAKITSELKSFLKETNVGGVILFARNYRSPKQLADFIKSMQDASETPLIVAVDQEGGRVARLTEPFTKIPPMSFLGRLGEKGATFAYDIGSILGKELSAVGIHINFAPVLDVATNPFNPVIGDRAMAGSAEEVSVLGAAFIRGMQAEGVAACAKHFPGHGDTNTDSHKGLPILPHTRRRFDVCEFKPFRAAIDAGVATMMTAHILAPNLDRSAPASASRAITTGILRHEMGFKGLVFTDCLTMKGITDQYSVDEAAWRVVAAGADMALVCHNRNTQQAALEGLRRAVGDGLIGMPFLSEALARISVFKERFIGGAAVRPPFSVIGCRAHQKIASKITS